MSSVLLNEPPAAGFSFENCKRNAMLAQKGYVPPKTTKTGTTICGVIFKDGVILAADTRSTAGDMVANKDCMKLHTIAPNMMCAGAGTSADCDKATAMISSQCVLHKLETDRQVPVRFAVTRFCQMLFRYQGHIGAYLILGGVDRTGPHLHFIAAHGSTDILKYGALGSGSLGATAVLEEGYKDDMTEEEAKELARRAIRAGIFNDCYSGSTVNLAVIKANDSIEMIHHFDEASKKGERINRYDYAKGSTAVLKTKTRPIIVESTTVTPIPMETK